MKTLDFDRYISQGYLGKDTIPRKGHYVFLGIVVYVAIRLMVDYTLKD